MSDVPSENQASQVAAKASAEPVSGESADAAGNRRRWTKLGVGAAIGSAAIVAALLYANRSTRHDGS